MNGPGGQVAAEVTWLLPVKNAMPYLPETLASIAAQTYPHARVLAWDNGSSDGSREELLRWIGPGKRLPGEVVTDQPTTLGVSLARMVERAETPWCARIDGDDVNEPQRLSAQMAYLVEHPDIAVLGTGLKLMAADGQIVDELPSEVTHHADVRWHLRFGNAISHPSVVFRRADVLAAGNYRDLSPGQDYDLWCRIAARRRVANLADLLVRYRMHDRSVTSRSASVAAATIERIQIDNLSLLWPGLTVDEWRGMRDLLGQVRPMPVTLADCVRLRAVATRAARAAGEADDYFRDTARYRDRAANVWTRWLKQFRAAQAIWPAARRLRMSEASPPATKRVLYAAAPVGATGDHP